MALDETIIESFDMSNGLVKAAAFLIGIMIIDYLKMYNKQKKTTHKEEEQLT